MTAMRSRSHADLLQLKRWNTPTICNGWEQVTRRNIAANAFNLEETRDFMPQMGQRCLAHSASSRCPRLPIMKPSNSPSASARGRSVACPIAGSRGPG